MRTARYHPLAHSILKLVQAFIDPLCFFDDSEIFTDTLSVSVGLDLIVEFIQSHLMKKFPHELYELALGVVLRVLCHQKRCRLRLTMCPWRDLWAALIALLKFLHGSDTSLIRKFDVFALATHAVNILNLFITFGDTFLPSPQSYDDLYYEIIRMYHVFDNLHAMGTTTVDTTTSITNFYHKKSSKYGVWYLSSITN